MPMTFRSVKGSALTHPELDGNFEMFAGGSTGQALRKISGTNYAWAWSNDLAVQCTLFSYTSNATYTKPSNLLFVIVEVCGGGGGGGGAAATGATGSSIGGGGGGGGYAVARVLANDLGSSTSVTIGGGGSGGSSAGGNGGNGGNSSFGSHAVASGGEGGQGGNVTSSGTQNRIGGEGGTGLSGSNFQGGDDGGYGMIRNGVYLLTNFGGGSHFSGQRMPNNTGPGLAGKSRGGGGSGAWGISNSSGRSGGAGVGGRVVVWQYRLV